MTIRALHLVKTSDGATWAARQAAVLVGLGIEVHVAVPARDGRCMPLWQESGAIIHVADTALDPRRPWRLLEQVRKLQGLVDGIRPDLVHAHFVANAMLMRLALRSRPALARLFQVPGPLHLEHGLTRRAEIATASAPDRWIASSRYIRDLYVRAGVPAQRVSLSYYGTDIAAISPRRTGVLRRRLGIADDVKMVGNISWMYPPKRWLGQRVGLKCHEDLISALGEVISRNPKVVGVLAGGGWNGAAWYERRLQDMAAAIGGGRIILLGPLDDAEVRDAWADFDLVVHVPSSENCGGVIEPLLAGVPVIATRVGGLPEVIRPGVTGTLVPPRSPRELAGAIESSLSRLVDQRGMAAAGKALVSEMFAIDRTAAQVARIYRRIVQGRAARSADVCEMD
ncbi:MAG: glycosyltransferase family 4 protein [Planctomycetes bacterium]|nr:glycosyltransferase family 4 protein [Planctomycetota bacterium]